MAGALIVNPKATRVTEERLAAVRAILPQPLLTVETTARGDGARLAADLEGEVDVLYVFSGDGTYNEVLNGLRGRVPLGLIPGGGTSVLPRALGLPRDPVAAARALARPATRRIGLARANGRRFAFNAGLGLDAELVRRVDALGRSADGRRPGDRAFGRAALDLLRERGFRLDPILELVGVGEVAFVLVANCDPYTYAGPIGLRFARHASFEGGIDVVAPASVSRARLPLVGWWALGRGSAHVRLHDVARAEVRSPTPLALQLDGEDLGDVTEVVFESEPDALTVLVGS